MDHTFHYFQFLFAYPTLTFVVVQSLSCLQLFVMPWTAACQASLSFTISRSLCKFMSIELMMPSNHLILCCPLLLLPSIFPSIRIFSNELALPIRCPKYWSSSFNISPSSEYSGWFPFWLTGLIFLQSKRLSRVLQCHSLKASILQVDGPMVQLSLEKP